jgi:hypothetical protein
MITIIGSLYPGPPTRGGTPKRDAPASLNEAGPLGSCPGATLRAGAVFVPPPGVDRGGIVDVLTQLPEPKAGSRWMRRVSDPGQKMPRSAPRDPRSILADPYTWRAFHAGRGGIHRGGALTATQLLDLFRYPLLVLDGPAISAIRAAIVPSKDQPVLKITHRPLVGACAGAAWSCWLRVMLNPQQSR